MKKLMVFITIILSLLALETGFYLAYFLYEELHLFKEETSPTDLTAEKINTVLAKPHTKTSENETNTSIEQTSYDTVKELPETLDYKGGFVALPLYPEDYYYGKHINATAAVKELNKISPLSPGDRVRIIRDGYLTMKAEEGYTKPGGNFVYASGVCWTVSTFGAIMDKANQEFTDTYGLPLFVFGYLDRGPHKKAYRTYTGSNYGYGYTVAIDPSGYVFDYSFTINPELSNIPELADIKVDIVMKSVTNHRAGYNGESIEGYVITNLNF